MSAFMGGAVMAEPDLLVEARGITVRLGGRAVLERVDIGVAPEEIVTVIGLNGAGKTTLVKVILGLVRPTAGTVRRRPGLRIGYVPQHLHRDASLPMTVRRFLNLGSRAPRSRLAQTLKEVGAPGLLDAQMVGLSGGELHRVLLARALIREPDLLVLDEPLAGVDLSGQSELYGVIQTIRKRHHCGVLLVSHDLHLVMRATDQVVCLNRHVCCTGHPETVATHPEFVNLFGTQVANTLGLYIHHHDHRHEIDGQVTPLPEQAGPDHAKGRKAARGA
jgi:zinc transport system ATP-binding protein